MRLFFLFVGNLGRKISEWADHNLDEEVTDIVTQMRKSWVPPKLAIK